MNNKWAGTRTPSRALLVAALSTAIGFGAVYVTLGGRDNARSSDAAAPGPSKAAPATPTAAATMAKLKVGEVAGFVFKKEPTALDPISFADAKGQQLTLADWKGRVVLLNLWATWCAPCRKEMPGLARLQKQLGSDKFEVVALAVDRAGASAAAKFLGSVDAEGLALYIDPTARAGSALKAVGMPTTLLLDGEGREIGRLTGPAEWDSPEAQRLVAAYLR